jgi:hypothetical protein
MHVGEQCSKKAHLGVLLEWSPAPMTFNELKISLEMSDL